MAKNATASKNDPDFEIVDDDEIQPLVNSKITLYGIHIHKIELEDKEGVTHEEADVLCRALASQKELVAAIRKQKGFWESAASKRTQERNEHGRESLALKNMVQRRDKEIARLNRQIKRLTEQKGKKKR